MSPDCGRRQPSGLFPEPAIRLRDCSIGDQETYLEVRPMRIACCGGTRVGGRVYFTIVTNLKSGRVVWIGDGKGRKGLLPFLRALGAQARRRLRGVVSDLGYQAILATRLRRAVHILDRFQIVQWMNDALTRLRRRLFSGA